MPITRPCPRCQEPMEIPQPAPEKIQCAKCGVVVQFKKAPAASAPVEKESPKPPPRPVEKADDAAKPSKAKAKESPSDDAPAKPRREAERDQRGGILSYLHTIIPKPILFGFYGALGGLLGVMVIGELLWIVLHPTPMKREVQLSVPPKLTVYRGNDNQLNVLIKRPDGLKGEVRLVATEMPWDITIPPISIAADKEEAVMVVSANEGADKGNHEVKLRATLVREDPKKAEVAEKIEPTETSINVWVDPTPPSLQISLPETVTVYAGGQNRFGFKIARRRFDGPVRVEVLDLPKGVTIPMLELPDGAFKNIDVLDKDPKKVAAKSKEGDAPAMDAPEQLARGEMTVVVAQDALGVGRDARPEDNPTLELEVRSLKKHTITTKVKLQFNILPPPGKLQLAVSPQVTVYPGSKNKFSVKISRGKPGQEFKAPVELTVTGQTRGVVFSKETIEEGKSEAVIEVFAGEEVLPSKEPFKGLMVTAKALSAEEITAQAPLVLNVTSPPPTIQMAVSPKVSVYPGGKASFGVKIARNRFTGPVEIVGAKVGSVSVPLVTIPADSTAGEVEVHADAAALNLTLPKTEKLNLIARSKVGGTSVSEPIQVEILIPPSDVQLTVSPDVEIYQVGKCKFTANIARSGFTGPVQLSFAKEPPGVTFKVGPIVANLSQIVVYAAATIDVAPKKYEIDVTATGPKAPDGKVPTITKKFTLDVKPFDLSARPPLDIVFVLDVTQSLDPQIQGLRNGIGQFVKALNDKELEARIGLVGFRDVTFDKDAIETLKFNGESFTTDTKLFAAELGKLKAMGGGDDPESSLEAIVEATNYPFRANALRVLLLITDEKPQSKGNSITMKVAQKALRDKKINQVHLIVKERDKADYAGLQTAATGGFFDFEKVSKKAKGSDGFASLLPLLSKEIATTIGAKEPVAAAPNPPGAAPTPLAPPVEKAPVPRAEASPSSPVAAIPQPPKAGEAPTITSAEPKAPEAENITAPPAEAPALKGVQSTAIYAAKDQFWLLLAVAFWTATLAGGIALLLVGAQKRYLQQSWLRIGEVLKALAAGASAGLIAGALGQWVYFSTPGSAIFGMIGHVAGWVILGGLIAGGMSFFVPNLKWKRALIGGCVGGFVGVIGFILTSHFAGEFVGRRFGELIGRWIGAALLGACIGVMVALAEIAFRRYWLEVAFGREVRTVTLGPTTIALGGDDKLASIFVSGAAPKALGYRVDRNRVICEDFATGRTADAPPGDERTLVGAKIRVCSSANAQATGVSLQLIVVREVALMEGMPLTADDIPGLEPSGTDGIVAVVNRRPNNPKIFVLRNRSKQPWKVTEADGNQRKVDPGMGIELSNRSEVDFGQVKAILDPGAGSNDAKKPDSRVTTD